MPTLSAALKTQLNNAVTKLDWSGMVNTLLTGTRRVRCFRDPNANAANPAATGVEFLNIGSTGTLPTAAGNIRGFGRITGTTKKLAADLSSGTSVVVLEGGGHSITFTLGLPGSSAEFILPASPTGAANEGYAFTPGSGVKAPILMDSGTGPLAPPMPNYTVEVEDWAGGTFQSVVGVLTPSTRLVNWVYDDSEMAQSQGDVRTHIAPVSVKLGEVEFGLMMWNINGITNAEGPDPVDELLIISKPQGANWPGYPRMSGYDPAVSNTIWPPCKLTVKKDGVVIKVHEMRDHLCLNHPTLNQTSLHYANAKPWMRGTDEAPVRQFMNTAQVLPFRTHRLKKHTYAQKYFPGQEPDILRPSTAKQKNSTNPPFPTLWAANTNGMNNWHGMVKWAPRSNYAEFSALPQGDPMLFNVNDKEPSYGSAGTGSVYTTGWGHEAASTGGHDIWTGNGGATIERGALPGPIAIDFTNPNHVYLRDGSTSQERVEAWNLNYCNIPWHWVADVTTGATIPFDEVCKSMWSFGGHTYYGGQDTYVPGGRAYSIDQFELGNGGGQDTSQHPFWGLYTDKNGLPPYGGGGTDHLHAYRSAAPVAYLYNSPMAAYLAKFSVMAVILAQTGDVPADKDPAGWLLTRQQAWRFKAFMEGWKLSSDHPWGMKREWIFNRAVIELEAVYNNDYTRVVINNAQDNRSKLLRNLGYPILWDGMWNPSVSQGLMFYLSGVFHLWKSTGFWDAIRGASEKCRLAIDFLVQCMDRYSADWIIETKGQYDWYDGAVMLGPWADYNTQVVSSWTEAAENRRNTGQDHGLDFITNSDGSRAGEPEGTSHCRYQWLCLRRDWITEAEIPRGSKATLEAGRTAFKGYYDKIAAAVAAQIAIDPNNAFNIRNADWTFRQPQFGVILPPKTV